MVKYWGLWRVVGWWWFFKERKIFRESSLLTMKLVVCSGRDSALAEVVQWRFMAACPLLDPLWRGCLPPGRWIEMRSSRLSLKVIFSTGTDLLSVLLLCQVNTLHTLACLIFLSTRWFTCSYPHFTAKLSLGRINRIKQLVSSRARTRLWNPQREWLSEGMFKHFNIKKEKNT